ncbi:MAG: SGNH/GDSL hydrolase family protein [Chitinophagales bacterium]
MKRFFFWCLLIAVVVALTELFGTLAFELPTNERASDMRKIRKLLLGEASATEYPRFLPLANLNYISYPGAVRNGVQQNNKDGYRGEAVDVNRNKNYRILFLGGSTTYGIGVPYPNQSYPEQLKKLLELQLQNDAGGSKKYTGVEIINAGIEYGTSSEEVIQYLFKYRYYHPDLCVINSGINDAMNDPEGKDYSPDYTNTRNIDFAIQPVPVQTRWLLRSRFVSFLVIPLFYDHLLQHRDGYLVNHAPPFYVKWFKQTKSPINAFYYNMNTLLRELEADSVAVILVTSAYKRIDSLNDSYYKNIELNNRILAELGATYKKAVVDFNYETFECKECFIDDCHLNEKGETDKASLVAPKVIEMLSRK